MIFITDMNKTDKENLKLIEYRLDEQDRRVNLLHQEFDSKLGDIHTDIKFIKENLFNPETGLWAETKQNSAFRKNTTMWRGIIGGGLIAALVESFWGLWIIFMAVLVIIVRFRIYKSPISSCLNYQ